MLRFRAAPPKGVAMITMPTRSARRLSVSEYCELYHCVRVLGLTAQTLRCLVGEIRHNARRARRRKSVV